MVQEKSDEKGMMRAALHGTGKAQHTNPKPGTGALHTQRPHSTGKQPAALGLCNRVELKKTP